MVGPSPPPEVEVAVAGSGLAERPDGTLAEPLAVFSVDGGWGEGWEERARTERLSATRDPVWAARLRLPFVFQQRQWLQVEVFDVVSADGSLVDARPLGRVSVSLARLLSAPRSALRLPLQDSPAPAASLALSLHDLSPKDKNVVVFRFAAKKLDNKDWLSKSDPFLVLLRLNDDGAAEELHRTEVVKNDLSPLWKPFSLPLQSLTLGSPQRLLILQVFDSDSDGGEDLIGEARASLAQMAASSKDSPLSLELLHPAKAAKKKGYKNSGLLLLKSFDSHPEYSFLDYIRGGIQMHFTVAVDFTASNGNPTEPSSLHYIHPHLANPYTLALGAVGSVIADYDEDALFPALGFGGKLPSGQVSHEFFLNAHPSDPHCRGVEGVLGAYRQALLSVQLYGPTNLAPVIRHVAKFAQAAAAHRSHYFVLLILTDGEVSDVDRTVDAVVQASALPMSIIVVGVGEERFEAMRLLDGDREKLVAANGQTAQRDVVQFVRFADYAQDFAPASGPTSGGGSSKGHARLARDVLQEIPRQLTAYMNARRFAPLHSPSPSPSAHSLSPPPPPTSHPAFNPAFAGQS